MGVVWFLGVAQLQHGKQLRASYVAVCFDKLWENQLLPQMINKKLRKQAQLT